MEKSNEAASQRMLGLEQEPAPQPQDTEEHIPERPIPKKLKLVLHNSPRDLKSPTPESFWPENSGAAASHSMVSPQPAAPQIPSTESFLDTGFGKPTVSHSQDQFTDDNDPHLSFPSLRRLAPELFDPPPTEPRSPSKRKRSFSIRDFHGESYIVKTDQPEPTDKPKRLPDLWSMAPQSGWIPFRERKRSSGLRASTPEGSTLKSPSPSPRQGPGSDWDPLHWVKAEMAREEAEMAASRESTATLPPGVATPTSGTSTLLPDPDTPLPSTEFVRPLQEVSRSWPADPAVGLNEPIMASTRALMRASPIYIRPQFPPRPMPQLPDPMFCCADLKLHLRTNPVMPIDLEKKHLPIIQGLVAKINPDLQERFIVPEDQFKEIDCIVKVNRVLHSTEISSHLFIISDKISDTEFNFKKICDLPDPLLFNPQGRGSYQSYCCDKHRTFYRIGVYDKLYRLSIGEYSFGDTGLDFVLGLVSKEDIKQRKWKALMRNY